MGLSSGQLPVLCTNSVSTQRKLRVTQTWQPQSGLQDIIRDGPHKWFRSLTEVPQARETSCAEEYQRTREKIDEQTTNEQEEKFCDLENHFYWDSRLVGGRRSFEDDQASILLQEILSGILWVRELCKGAGNLAAGYPLKTSSTTTVQGRAQLHAALVKKQF